MREDGFVSATVFDAGISAGDRSLIGRHGAGSRRTLQSPNEALQPEAPPPPPPRPPSRRRPTLSALSGFLSFLGIVGFGALVTYVFVQNRLAAPGPLEQDKVVVISHSETRSPVDELAAEGVIDSPFVMNLVLTAEHKRGKVKAGEYLFKQHASLQAVIDELVSGREVLHPITIPEGLTSAQIVQRLRDSDVLVGEIRQVPKEGTLLPETYKVARGMTRAKLIAMMQEDDRRVVDQIWARRSPDLPLRSPYELVTLASVVEKETGKADERPRVAGVFINRLRKHMRLQSDPTIVYGLVGGQGTLGHSITRAELDKKTPYNTYQIDGLPPGPIDNPGRAALEAVANPSRTLDLYFVADGTGGHAFADTIDQHNRNVARWRAIEKDAKDKSDVDKLAPSALTPGASKPTQRSDASEADFGVLPASVGAEQSAPAGDTPKLLDPAVRDSVSKVAAAAERIAPPATSRGRGTRGRAGPVDASALATGIDTAALSFADMAPPRADRGKALLDGPVAADPGAPHPESAGSAALASLSPDELARQASPPPSVPRAQLDAVPNAGADKPDPTRATAPAAVTVAPRPADTMAVANVSPPHADSAAIDLFADPAGGSGSVVPTKTAPLHPKIFDASENTAIDPLRNKTFDLNTAKTIPADLVH